MAALNHTPVNWIVLKAGIYEFTSDTCSYNGSAALCIDRAITIEAEVSGSVVLDGGGERRVISVLSTGNATLIGLNITRGFAAEDHVSHQLNAF